MDVQDWLATHWLGTLLAADLSLFVLAILLWKPRSRPLAMALGVVALVPVLALVGVAFDGIDPDDSGA